MKRHVAVLGVLAFMTACERPPVGAPGPDDVEGRVVVDLPLFQQDRPAIGGKWYEYSVDGHVLEPKDEAWIVRVDDGAGGTAHVAFRIASIYDDNTGESGVFHLDVAAHDGAVWGASARFVATTNVKTASSCVDLVAAAAGAAAERACDDAAPWHLRLVSQSRLSVFAGIAVAEPAIYLHGAARAARVDGVGLSALPAPSSLADLNDGPSALSTDWAFASFAPDLPEAGQAVGDIDRLVGQDLWLFSSGFRLAHVIAARDGASLTLSASVREVDTADQSVDAADPTAADLVVDLGALPVYLAVTDAGLATVDAANHGVSGALRPGNSRRWDLAVVDDVAGVVGPRVILSPGAAALDILATGLTSPFVASESP